MSVKIVNELKDSGLDKLDNFGSPFLSYEFFQSLEESESIGKGTGWSPFYITDPGISCLFTFIKDNSYGEYIFDWDWANFYHKYNIAYYPKLTSMIPFTSATTPHFVGGRSKAVMETYEKFYNTNDFSSSHFLFITESELEFFRYFGYIIRDSFQYHFENKDYTSFENFLSNLKNKKAKQIRKERCFDENIKLNQFTGPDLTPEHGEEMYDFYLSTIGNKNAIPYLTKSFFIKIFERLKDNIYYVQATNHGLPIAGALYFYNDDCLYGRYWGAKDNIANLHFELCYYQGIEICIKNSIAIFEAGAQGEHKISRGFRPVKTYSAHKFKHPDFHHAINKYIEDERTNVEAIILQLSERLPFK
jgi:predicted N-acyltransferase